MDKARRIAGGPARVVVLRVKREPARGQGVLCLFAELAELDDAARLVAHRYFAADTR
jgi:hypothetical protein